MCRSRCYTLGPHRLAHAEAAGAVALQVERDVLIAERLQRAHHREAHVGIERARHLIPRDLHARHCVVVTHAKNAKSQRANRLFGIFDRTQLAVRHFRVIRNAGGKARRRRLVPRWQPGVT